MPSLSDAELVRAARSSDRDAYDELVRRYQRQVYGLACVLLGDRSEAEDITQETFLRAWLNLDLLSDPAKFERWVRRIVFGASIDWLRAFRPGLYRLANTDAESELLATPSATMSALAALESVEMRERIWQAVAKLPPRYRLPLKLFHLDGLSHAQIAESMGVTESTIRSLVTRARQKLEPMLMPYAKEVLPALKDVLKEQPIKPPKMLHITDGESVAGTLRQSAVPGEVRIFGDLMYEGPAPAGLTDAEWWDTRVRFLTESGIFTLAKARHAVKTFEDSLIAISNHDEIVLWMDHRLSDQLILIMLLERFYRLHAGRSSLSLICVGHYPCMENFVGLGQLTGEQLASLADTRSPVSEAEFALASAAWIAFTSSVPTDIELFIARDTSALPFLAPALRRHLEQFPSVVNGLSRSERQTLSILRDRGALPALQLFFAVQKMEDPLFMGDLSFFAILRELASARLPLIQTESKPESPVSGSSVVTLTEVGSRVLEGQEDHVKLNGIERWLGGVHLTGTQAVWRWDGVAKRLRFA
jgi:RNA polymerase sigma factor (sigma-70 family)